MMGLNTALVGRVCMVRGLAIERLVKVVYMFGFGSWVAEFDRDTLLI